MLTRDEILNANDIRTERVEAWGGYVLVRGMTGTERDSFEESIVEIKDEGRGKNLRRTTTAKMDNIRAKLVSRCVVDETGKRLFTDADAEALGRKSAVELDKVFSVAQRLSGISAEDLEDLEKNSESAQNDEPGSS